MAYTIGYGNTTDVRGVPIYRAPTADMINQINVLQYHAGSMGVAIALTSEYTQDDIDIVSSELSRIIEGDE